MRAGGAPDTLETRRLLLRRWRDDDAPLLAGLATDRRMVRHILDGKPWTHEKAGEVARAAVTHWRAHGFGWRVAVDKPTAVPLGFIALSYAGEGTVEVDPDEFEIGWWLAPDAWRRGLATEGARAICAEAFERVGASSVIARLQPANSASAGVARRLGMTLELDTTGRAGEVVSVYRLSAEDWRAGNPRHPDRASAVRARTLREERDNPARGIRRGARQPNPRAGGR